MDILPEHNRKFSLSWTPRVRWNVLDMIEILGRSSIPTYLFFDIDLSWAEELRAKLKKMGYRITITSILLKAIGLAQRHHPDTRTARMPWGQILKLNEVAAGFTVEKLVNNQPAVFFGLIKNPDTKSLVEISAQINEYALRESWEIPQLDIENRFARLPWIVRRVIIGLGLIFPNVRLKYLGATFGFSSLGKLGVKMVIPPCVSAVTFGMGAVEERPVVRHGKIEIRPMATIVLNFDHRLIDGAPVARFMQDVQSLLEGGLGVHVDEELAALQQEQQQQQNSRLSSTTREVTRAIS